MVYDTPFQWICKVCSFSGILFNYWSLAKVISCFWHSCKLILREIYSCDTVVTYIAPHYSNCHPQPHPPTPIKKSPLQNTVSRRTSADLLRDISLYTKMTVCDLNNCVRVALWELTTPFPTKPSLTLTLFSGSWDWERSFTRIIRKEIGFQSLWLHSPQTERLRPHGKWESRNCDRSCSSKLNYVPFPFI
jgi:hypothetical protein